MNKLLHLTTLSFVIASLGTTALHAQEATPQPGEVSTPVAPATPVTPTPTTPMQSGVCGTATMSSSNVDATSTYTAGPWSKSKSGEQASMSDRTSTSTKIDNQVAATSENTPGQPTTNYNVGGYSADAPRLIKASSSVTQEYHEIGPSHHIELYSGANPLCYVSVQPRNDILTESNDSIRVFNKSTGNELDIKVTKLAEGGAKVVFAQPVAPKTTLEIAINGVEYDSQTAPSVVQYSLAGGYVNLNQEIPFGVAQVNRHLY
jgi:hypothetical protein